MTNSEKLSWNDQKFGSSAKGKHNHYETFPQRNTSWLEVNGVTKFIGSLSQCKDFAANMESQCK